jgi:hypothetical protein
MSGTWQGQRQLNTLGSFWPCQFKILSCLEPLKSPRIKTSTKRWSSMQLQGPKAAQELNLQGQWVNCCSNRSTQCLWLSRSPLEYRPGMMWYIRMSINVGWASRASRGRGWPLAAPRFTSSCSKAASVGASSCKQDRTAATQGGTQATFKLACSGDGHSQHACLTCIPGEDIYASRQPPTALRLLYSTRLGTTVSFACASTLAQC